MKPEPFRASRVALAAAAFALGLSLSWQGVPHWGSTPTDTATGFGLTTAEARPGMRTARRVDRRTTRRTVARTTAYLDTLPADCIVRGQYWYCGGTYYEKAMESGREVYMVVTP
jgi:hypothetical protein